MLNEKWIENINMVVMKFGGTSVANTKAITSLISIVKSRLAENQKPIIVVSALSKVTDMLYKLADSAAAKNFEETNSILSELRKRHLDLAAELLETDPSLLAQAQAKINEILDNLSNFVAAVGQLGELSDRSKAVIYANGEYLSSNIICFALNHNSVKTNYMNARDMIVTSKEYLKGEPITEEICKKVPQVVSSAFEGVEAIITQGFVSATIDGEPTVLGRGGSDYSASLIGMAVDSKTIEIWTDVDGVKTADPRKVNNTKSLVQISFEEAAEMAYFGAKVLHPLTIEPAVKKNIPIYVLNSKNPSGVGTVILQSEFIEDGVKSVSFKENIRLINIFSPKMINTSGFLNKVFEIFSENKVSVDLISTSEANISVTVDATQNIEKVVEELSRFAEVNVDTEKSQVSIIGKNIVNMTGTLSKILRPLDDCKVYMISQGASFVNISFVIDKFNLDKVVQRIHKLLFEDESCN